MTVTALLLALDGTEKVLRLPYPPPPEWLVPAWPRWNVTFRLEPPCDPPPPHRRFRLSMDLRSPEHPWMRVYSEGRSQTPEPAYVYTEVRQ